MASKGSVKKDSAPSVAAKKNTHDEKLKEDLTCLVEDFAKAHNGQRVTLEDFSLIRVIGKGSFGKVTLVRKKDNSKVFAMKVLSKNNIVKRKQVEHTRTERRVLAVTSHPFIVNLHYAFQSTDKLYFVLDYCPGGELFFHLSRMGRFTEAMVKFYAAELVVALQHLHSLGVVYRDLKPENILLDEFGHIKLADFGLAKDNVTAGDAGATSLCGTPEYLAPEVLDRLGHGTAVDWWALGMVMYEMLTGLPPWYTRNRPVLFANIRRAPLNFPDYVSVNAKSFISGLLQRDPTKRLGYSGAAVVKKHAFFNGIDWDGLLWSEPPFRPANASSKEQGDTSNFDKEFTDLPVGTDTPCSKSTGSTGLTRSMFTGFTYEAPTGVVGSDSSHSKSNPVSNAFI